MRPLDHDLFKEQAGVLTFRTDLLRVGREKFGDALERLVAGDAAAPVVDLSCTNYVPSKFLALVMKAAAGCRAKGRELTLIAQPNVAKLFEQTGFAGIGRIGKAGG